MKKGGGSPNLFNSSERSARRRGAFSLISMILSCNKTCLNLRVLQVCTYSVCTVHRKSMYDDIPGGHDMYDTEHYISFPTFLFSCIIFKLLLFNWTKP